MKRFFLLIFVTFCALIFYQIVLGKNGVIEGYRIQKEKERLIYYKLLLKEKGKDLDEYIDFLKNDPDALRTFAEQLGFFNDQVKIIKVLDEIDNNKIIFKEIDENIDTTKLLKDVEKKYDLEIKIRKLRMWLSVIFYLFFGFFIVLIIFGVQKKDE